MPAPATVNTPVHLFLAVAGIVVTKTFAVPFGTICLLNTGAADCWITLDGAAPAAADGDGQTRLVHGGPALNMTNTFVQQLKAISTGAAAIQIVGQQAPDASGGMS